MSTQARVAGWVAALIVAARLSWHLGRFNGLQLLIIIAILSLAARIALRGIDSQRSSDDVDRFAEPTPLHTDRRMP